LSEFFKSIKKPKYVLGTTYTLSLAFFESVVFPYINRSELKSCLIISDALGYNRALEESSALMGAGQSYLVVPAPVPGCFHAKVWLVASDDEVALLVGSGNLTQSGFMGNEELFSCVRFSKEQPISTDLLEDIVSFIRGLAGMWGDQDGSSPLCVEVLSEITDLLGRFESTAADSVERLIHNFNGSLVDQLPDLETCSALYVAAPYFGGSTSGLELLMDKYRPQQLHLFPSVHNNESTDLPLDEVKGRFNPDTLAQLQSVKKGAIFNHLKLYGVPIDEELAWMFCTSANCTKAALQGPNVEAGLLKRVDRSLLSGYFSEGNNDLPDGRLEYRDQELVGRRFSISSHETTAGLNIQISELSQSLLPLSDVDVIVRAGSHVCAVTKDKLFVDRSTEHLLWTAFEGWSRPRHCSLSIVVNGKGNSGDDLGGSCFVDNHLLLTADPLQRSAWRGALALLGGEAMPELADIGAIFSLASNIIDGHVVQKTNPQKEDKDTSEEKSEDDQVYHVPVWPPEAVDDDLRRRIGTTGWGHLQFCQRILSVFFSGGSEGDSGIVPSDEVGGEDAPAEETAQQVVAREKEWEQQRKGAERILSQAVKDYERLHKKLQRITPDDGNKDKIWPGAIFVFLATMAVVRVTLDMTGEDKLNITVADLKDDFLKLLLHERKQPPNFCCAPGLDRYRRTPFPDLASDLRNTFDIELDTDLSQIMFAVVVDQTLRKDPQVTYPMPKRTMLKKINFSAMETDRDAKATCTQIWLKYLRAGTRYSEDEFSQVYDGLVHMWEGDA
jgi:hypothetical protein